MAACHFHGQLNVEDYRVRYTRLIESVGDSLPAVSCTTRRNKMRYMKPMILSTIRATSMIQIGIDKPGNDPDGQEGTNSAYRSDE